MSFSAPALRSTFVGRDDEVVALGQPLEHPSARLVTITGPGGVPGKFERAWARGERLSFSEVIAIAGDPALLDPEVSKGPIVDEHVALLTRREREVLALIIDGRTDREFAHALSISLGTASRHVANILHKLDVRTRSAAAAWAIRNGLS